MKIDGWRYYNHAAIPTTPIHESPNMQPIEDGSIWKMDGSPLLARWITEFDCGYETNWWYVIKRAPFELERLEAKARKHIRQALKKVIVKSIDMDSYVEELISVHNAASSKYSGPAATPVTSSEFANRNDPSLDCWGAFDAETERMIGYMTCRRKAGFVETVAAKYDPQYLNLRASDAIHFTVLDYYLNQEKFAYVSSGNRNINHITNAQEYKIATFGFTKAYCKLHTAYQPKIKWVIKMLYPIRKILLPFDRIGVVHLMNSVFKMEEICRGEDAL